MDTKSQYVQWEVFNFFPRAIDNEFRCINPELRCIMPKVNTRRSMVSVGEEILHICMWLELKAAKLAILTFTITKKKGISIHVRRGNMKVLPYLIKMAATKNQVLFSISKEIWYYCRVSGVLSRQRNPGI